MDSQLSLIGCFYQFIRPTAFTSCNYWLEPVITGEPQQVTTLQPVLITVTPMMSLISGFHSVQRVIVLWARTGLSSFAGIRSELRAKHSRSGDWIYRGV